MARSGCLFFENLSQLGIVGWSAGKALHEITVVEYIAHANRLVTGSQSGHVCIWEYAPPNVVGCEA